MKAGMTIEIREPELERMAPEELLSGRFRNAEEVVTEAPYDLREKHPARGPFAAQAEPGAFSVALAVCRFGSEPGTRAGSARYARVLNLFRLARNGGSRQAIGRYRWLAGCVCL
jgi:hypothetical protein